MTNILEAVLNDAGIPAVQSYDPAARPLPRFTLIIPAHNEERRLPQTLELYDQALRSRYGKRFEIIVVANGCEDDTARVAAEAASERDEITVLEIRERIGKGGAVLRGFHAARGDYVVFADADGATAPESLLELFEQLEHHEGVVGSRRLPGSTIARPQSGIKIALSRVFAAAVSTLFRLGYSDTQCGAKGFRRAAVAKLVALVTETGWAFDVDLLLCAEQLGLDVVEYPVHWTDDEHSRLRVIPTTLQVSQALLQLKRRHAAHAVAARQGLRTGVASPASLRILALNWRCLCHPQAGGAEVNLFEQARRWAKQGHSVTVVCARSDGPCTQCAVDGVKVVHMGGRFGVYPRVAAFLLRHGRELRSHPRRGQWSPFLFSAVHADARHADGPSCSCRAMVC